jgi:hypothetical protein
MNITELSNQIVHLTSDKFIEAASEIFAFQYKSNPIYRQWTDRVGRYNVVDIDSFDFPFLPISFFKTHSILSSDQAVNTPLVFKSSGTSGLSRSKHAIVNPALYERSFTECFKLFFGNPTDYKMLALLPSYIEQGESSLVYMANHLMKLSETDNAHFLLNEFHSLYQHIQQSAQANQKILLWGVTYALLDFAERFPIYDIPFHIVETGGMKGRKKELTREEVHQQLKKAFPIATISSEYGMTELLSQSYALDDVIFQSPPWKSDGKRHAKSFYCSYLRQRIIEHCRFGKHL